MAQPEAPATSSSAAQSPSWLEQLQKNVGTGPKFWQHFRQKEEQAEQAASSAAFAASASDASAAGVGPQTLPKVYVPPSGAHVMLKDLARDVKTLPPLPPSSLEGGWVNEEGWVGTPDPSKYSANTTYLSPAELKDEIEKGNVMLLKVCMSGA